jgi:hypothetical protein
MGCDPIYVDIPQDPPALSVNSVVFTPDSTLLFYIGRSTPLVSERISFHSNYITDARVVVSDNTGNSFSAEYCSDGIFKGFYRSFVKPKINTKYFLEVSAPNLPIATAESELPEPVSIGTVTIDSLQIRSAIEKQKENQDLLIGNESFTTCEITFVDPIDRVNFYEIRVFAKGFGTETDASGQPVPVSWVTEVFLLSDDVELESIKNPYPGNFVIFDDSRFNGMTRKVRVKFDTYYFYEPNFKEIKFALRSLSKDYFLYLKSLALQTSLVSDPFAQPVQVYNNIQNGLGNFGGYSQDVFEIIRK